MIERLLFSPRCSRIVEALLRRHVTDGSRFAAAINENRGALGLGKKEP